MSEIPRGRGVVDITFLLDATGSMTPCIDAVKEQIGVFLESLRTKDANNANPIRHFRVRTVGYRDCGERDFPWLVENDFTDDIAVIRQQLAALDADGGGDEPESLLEALYAVAGDESSCMKRGEQSLHPRKWRARTDATRVIVVFTDASYHPQMQQPAGGTLDDVINRLHEQRIMLSLFAPDMPCHDQLSEVDGAEYHAIPGSDPQAALREFVSNPRNFAATLKQLARTITATAAAQ
jgi:hypothetical protein